MANVQVFRGFLYIPVIHDFFNSGISLIPTFSGSTINLQQMIYVCDTPPINIANTMSNIWISLDLAKYEVFLVMFWDTFFFLFWWLQFQPWDGQKFTTLKVTKASWLKTLTSMITKCSMCCLLWPASWRTVSWYPNELGSCSISFSMCYLSDVAKSQTMYCKHVLHLTFEAHHLNPRYQRYDRLQPPLNAAYPAKKINTSNANPINSPLSSSHTRPWYASSHCFSNDESKDISTSLRHIGTKVK